MAHFKNINYTPDKDAGWGLIYRTNDLWVLAQKKALAAEFDDWSFILDMIYCNLDFNYKTDKIEIKKDEKSGKIAINHLGKKEKEFNLFNEQIALCKKKMKEAFKNEDVKAARIEYAKARIELYNTVRLKDRWLRKFEMELGLYLKQLDKNDPRHALSYGG